jgi:hypothetical protein
MSDLHLLNSDIYVRDIFLTGNLYDGRDQVISIYSNIDLNGNNINNVKSIFVDEDICVKGNISGNLYNK